MPQHHNPANDNRPSTALPTDVLDSLEVQLSTIRKSLEAATSLGVQFAEIRRSLAAAAAAAAAPAPAPAPRLGKAEVLAAVKRAGNITVAQIMKELPGLQKSSAWMHVKKLAKEGEVRLESTCRGRTDGHFYTIVWHRDSMIT